MSLYLRGNWNLGSATASNFAILRRSNFLFTQSSWGHRERNWVIKLQHYESQMQITWCFPKGRPVNLLNKKLPFFWMCVIVSIAYFSIGWISARSWELLEQRRTEIAVAFETINSILFTEYWTWQLKTKITLSRITKAKGTTKQYLLLSNDRDKYYGRYFHYSYNNRNCLKLRWLCWISIELYFYCLLKPLL